MSKGKLTGSGNSENSIPELIRGGAFEVCDGGGLWLRYREGDNGGPVWRFRYRIGGMRVPKGERRMPGKARTLVLGRLSDLPLAKARVEAVRLRGDVARGIDVVTAEKAARAAQVAGLDAEAGGGYTVAQLAADFFEAKVKGRVDHPNIVTSRIEKHIRPVLGKLAVKDVKPLHIKDLLQVVNGRGTPTIANDVLRLLKRMFNEAVKWEKIDYNPASAYDLSDAGGIEKPRKRALSRDELAQFFEAMRKTKGLSVQNVHTFKLLLLLAVRKQELTAARVDEFDLDNAVWELPEERTKTSAAIDIPLSPSAVRALRELVRMGNGSEYLLPARKVGGLPHIHENTLNVALSKVHRKMLGAKFKDEARRFTIHDFRRTARTQLAALKVDRFIAERCLNHAIKGVEGTYDRHAYFDERREALEKLAVLIDDCEAGKSVKAEPAKRKTKRKAKTRGR